VPAARREEAGASLFRCVACAWHSVFRFSVFLDSGVFPCFCTQIIVGLLFTSKFLGEITPPLPVPPTGGRPHHTHHKTSHSLDSISVVRVLLYRIVQRRARSPPHPSLTSIIECGKRCQNVAQLSRPPAAMKQIGTRSLLMALMDVTQVTQGSPCGDTERAQGYGVRQGRCGRGSAGGDNRHIGVGGAREAKRGPTPVQSPPRFELYEPRIRIPRARAGHVPLRERNAFVRLRYVRVCTVIRGTLQARTTVQYSSFLYTAYCIHTQRSLKSFCTDFFFVRRACSFFAALLVGHWPKVSFSASSLRCWPGLCIPLVCPFLHHLVLLFFSFVTLPKGRWPHESCSSFPDDDLHHILWSPLPRCAVIGNIAKWVQNLFAQGSPLLLLFCNRAFTESKKRKMGPVAAR
jgi:hypothetical protein